MTILSSGMQYSTEYENMEDCLQAKKELMEVNPSGIESFCISQSDKKITEFDRDMEESTQRLARTMLSTFQAILTKILIDAQRNGLNEH